MTNEEAMEIINTSDLFWSRPTDKECVALDMAIEALKDVQNCVHCEHYTEVETDTGIHGECKMDTVHRGDLISRQAATSIPILPKEYRKVCNSMNDAFETGWYEALACVNMLPSEEPKTGHWVEGYADELHLLATYTCSECGNMELSGSKFCPNCGSFNGGEEE